MCDPEIVSQLPGYVQLKLPGVLTRQSGLTWRVVRTLSVMPPQGTSFSSICDMDNEKAHKVHKMTELEYLMLKRGRTIRDFFQPAGGSTAGDVVGGSTGGSAGG